MSSRRSARDFGRGLGSKQPQSMALPRARLIAIAAMKTKSMAATMARAPVGIAVLVDVDVVELDAPQFLREHVRVLAIAAGAVDDDRLRLLRRLAALVEELAHFVVDVGFPDGEGTRAGDVALFVDRGAPRVEDERAGVVERLDVVVLDLDVGLVGVDDEA